MSQGVRIKWISPPIFLWKHWHIRLQHTRHLRLFSSHPTCGSLPGLHLPIPGCSWERHLLSGTAWWADPCWENNSPRRSLPLLAVVCDIQRFTWVVIWKKCWWSAQLSEGKCWCWEPTAPILAPPCWLFKLNQVWTKQCSIILFLLEELFWSKWGFPKRCGLLSCLSWALSRSKGLFYFHWGKLKAFH